MRFGLLFTFLLSFSSFGFSWHAPGHQVTAIIAYRSLKPDVQEKYIKLLASHPYYPKWIAEHKLFTDVSINEFLFCKASTWPDVIKKDDYPDKHKEWHYINYKVDFENGHVKKDQNKGDNVLSAIDKNSKILRSKKASNEARAIALSWLIHLIGDISQPMHCAALFTKEQPKGDLGGNKTYFRLDTAFDAQSVHSLWDGLPGELSLDSAAKRAGKLLKMQAPSDSLLRTTPQAWSLEGMALAIKYAYREGEVARLPFIKSEYYAPLLPNAEEYMKRAREIANQQLLLGGLRLAAFIS